MAAMTSNHTMRLRQEDKEKIEYLKKGFGLVNTSEVIRFCMTYTIRSLRKE